MNNKKLILVIFLFILSASLGFLLGTLNFLSFLEGNSLAPLKIILLSIVVSYLVAIAVFILDFSDGKNINLIYLFLTFIFGLGFFLSQGSLTTTLLSSVFYFAFLYYIEYAGISRSRLFIRFKPNEIFLPVIKHAFAFLLIIFAILGFSSTKELMSENKITPRFVLLAAKPIVVIVNEQLGKQLEKELGRQFRESIGAQSREEIVRFVLSEMVKTMAEGQTQQFFGFAAREIPIGETQVYPDGRIDIYPVIQKMAPEIAGKINTRYGHLIFIIPFFAAIIIILLLQPLLLPFHLIAGLLLVPITFTFLKETGFLRVIKEKIEVEKVYL